MGQLSRSARLSRALVVLLLAVVAAVVPALYWGRGDAGAIGARLLSRSAPARVTTTTARATTTSTTKPGKTTTTSTTRAPATTTTSTTRAPATTTSTTAPVTTTSTTAPTTTTAPSPTTTTPVAPPTQVPSVVQNLTGTAVPGTDEAKVTWTAPSSSWGAAAGDTASVQVFDLTLGWQQFGQIATCAVGGVCDGSATIRGLVNGHQYLAAVWATNAIGAGPATATAVFVADTGCAVAACVNVDATAAGQPFRNVASGFNGNDIIPQNTSLLGNLNVSWWRLSSFGLPGGPNPPSYTAFDTARAKGAKIIELLSDDWWQQTYPANNGDAPNPADNWAAWDSFVKTKVAQSIADGRSPDYWEVWNEPGGNTPPVVGGPLTLDEQLQLYEHTWHDIHSVAPDAKIASAGTVGFGEAPGLYSGDAAAQYLPIPQLLDFVQSHGLTVDLLTWHEDGAPQDDAVVGFPSAAGDRIATARRWLDQRGMTATKINVDEYLPPSVIDDPAWNLAYYSTLEQSSADGAARSCWAHTYTTGPWGPGSYPGCNWGQLDNLADLNGQDATAAWWVMKLYSNLHGRVVPAPSSSSYLPALATVDGNTTTVLLGQASTCSGEIRSASNPFCAATWTSTAPMTVSVRVHLPSAGAWSLTQTNVPNTADILSALPAPSTQVVQTDASGWATVSLSAADGAVTQLQFTPAS